MFLIRLLLHTVGTMTQMGLTFGYMIWFTVGFWVNVFFFLGRDVFYEVLKIFY